MNTPKLPGQPPIRELILRLLRHHPGITGADVYRRSGRPQSSITNELTKMQREGVVERRIVTDQGHTNAGRLGYFPV